MSAIPYRSELQRATSARKNDDLRTAERLQFSLAKGASSGYYMWLDYMWLDYKTLVRDVHSGF